MTWGLWPTRAYGLLGLMAYGAMLLATDWVYNLRVYDLFASLALVIIALSLSLCTPLILLPSVHHPPMPIHHSPLVVLPRWVIDLFASLSPPAVCSDLLHPHATVRAVCSDLLPPIFYLEWSHLPELIPSR